MIKLCGRIVAAISIVLLTASNSLAYKVDAAKPIKSIGAFEYGPRNLRDRNLLTAWCTSGKAKEKPWIEITYKTPRSLESLIIVNGYAKSEGAYRSNARPKKVTIRAKGEKIAGITLDDKRAMQKITFKQVSAKRFKIIIDDIYKGGKYDDICLTEIIDQPRVDEGYQQLINIESVVGRRALTVNEIRDDLTPFIKKYYQRESDPTFWAIVLLRSSRFDERGLRLLMDLSYCEKKYYQKKAVNVDIQSGLKATVIKFIINKPEVILSVLNDETQVEWDLVKRAVDTYYGALPPRDVKKNKSFFEELINKLRKKYPDYYLPL